MADITMCKSRTCPMREDCYRAIATPDTLQSWFAEEPREGDKCAFYIPTRKP
jgi:hypothetical protein